MTGDPPGVKFVGGVGVKQKFSEIYEKIVWTRKWVCTTAKSLILLPYHNAGQAT